MSTMQHNTVLELLHVCVHVCMSIYMYHSLTEFPQSNAISLDTYTTCMSLKQLYKYYITVQTRQLEINYNDGLQDITKGIQL